MAFTKLLKLFNGKKVEHSASDNVQFANGTFSSLNNSGNSVTSETVVTVGTTPGSPATEYEAVILTDRAYIVNSTLLLALINPANWPNGIYTGTTTNAVEGQVYIGEDYRYEYQNNKFTRYSHRAKAYANMYGDDIAETITVSVAATYYPLTAGMTFDGNLNVGFASASELVIQVPGVYKVDWSASVECGVAGQYVEGGLMVNTDEALNTIGATELPTANKTECVGGTGLLTLAYGDIIRLGFENETGTNDITVTHAGVTILRVD